MPIVETSGIMGIKMKRFVLDNGTFSRFAVPREGDDRDIPFVGGMLDGDRVPSLPDGPYCSNLGTSEFETRDDGSVWSQTHWYKYDKGSDTFIFDHVADWKLWKAAPDMSLIARLGRMLEAYDITMDEFLGFVKGRQHDVAKT